MSDDDLDPDPEDPRPEGHYPRFQSNPWHYVPDGFSRTISLGPGGDELGVSRQAADRRLRNLRSDGRVSSEKIGASLVWFFPREAGGRPSHGPRHRRWTRASRGPPAT